MPPLPFFARLSRSQQQAILLALGVVLAALANYYCPRIVLRHSLVLGGAVYWALLPALGPRKAALVLLTHFSALWFKWGDPYSAGLIALEAIVVGVAWRRGISPVLADLLYWLCAGLPAAWWIFDRLLLLPQPTLGIALALQPVNGLIAIWLAHLARSLLGTAPMFPRTFARPRLGRVLLTRYLAFGTIPVLVAGIAVGNAYERNARQAARESVAQLARSSTATLGTFLENTVSLVEHTALRQTSTAVFNPDTLAPTLLALQQRQPEFISMLAADSTGLVFAAAPASALATLRSAPLNVADRSYFREAIRTGEPHVSSVFRGRGFGRDLLVAISAPAFDDRGRLLGIVEGSIAVRKIQEELSRRISSPDSHLFITDSQHQIVHTLGLPGLDAQVVRHELTRHFRESDEQVRLVMLDLGPVRESYIAVSHRVPGYGWQVVVLRPMTVILRPIVYTYLLIVLIGLGTALFATAFVGWSIRDIVQSFERIIRFSQDNSTSQLRDIDRARMPMELQAVIANLHEMAVRLENEKLRREELLARLESMVAERTQELRHALELAQSAERAKDAFLATVSHELRTPLTSIVTGTRLLRLGAANQPPPIQRTIQTMEQSGQVLMELISDVLEYSKIQAGGLKIDALEFRPADLAHEAIAIIRPRTEARGIQLILDIAYPENAPWVSDPRRVRQIVLNLLGNAAKFTQSGQVALRTWIEQDRLCFSVTDTGGGIPGDMLEAIFEPFVQVDTDRVSSTAGTGLGLTISRRLCDLLGGQISVFSEPGQGTTFSFSVPRL